MNDSLHKTILSLAVLVGAISLLVHDVLPAKADVGPTVSYGANPIRSFTGYASGTDTILEVPADSDFVITDLILTKTGSSTGTCEGTVSFQTSASPIAYFVLSSGTDGNSGWGSDSVTHSFTDGLLVLAGETLEVTGSVSCGSIAWVISGHFARP